MTAQEYIVACNECDNAQRAAELLRIGVQLAEDDIRVRNIAERMKETIERERTAIKQYAEQVERLKAEIEDLNAELEDKRIQLAELGSLSALIGRLGTVALRLEQADKPTAAKEQQKGESTAADKQQDKPTTTKKQVSKKTDSKQSEPRAKYGEYKHVLLTGAQYTNLVKEFGAKVADEYIQKVDEYCQQNGKTYKDYNLTVRKFMREDKVKLTKNSAESGAGVHSYDVEKILQYSKENIPKLKGEKK